jgi:hypothetical protein
MKETFKNFVAMVVASALWVLALLIIPTVYYLFESGPVIEEIVFLAVIGILLTLGILFTRKSERMKAALEFPLFPGS